MKSELFSLSRLFTETLFRIPDYQRGYAWTNKQIRDFWNDIDQLETGTNHYAGVLTLEQVPKLDYERWDDDLWIIDSKGYQPFYVVDGQQRLTTAMILLQVIIEKMNDEDRLHYTSKEEIRKKFIFESRDGGISHSYLFGYDKDNPSHEFMKQRIFLERSDAHSVPEATIYTRNLNEAKTYFASRVSDVSIGRLEQLFRILTQAVLFNSYVIASDIDVFVTFETMNNRGKLLSTLELLKNRLIYLSTKLPVAAEERKKLRSTINECWKTAYHFLGRTEDENVDDDIFLRRHYALYFGARELARELAEAAASGDEDEDEDEDEDMILTERLQLINDEYGSYLLEKHFVVRNIREPSKPDRAVTLQSLYEYAHSIKAYVKIHYKITNPFESSFSESETKALAQLSRIGEDRHGRDTQLLVLSIFASNIGSAPELRAKALQLLENILFIGTLGWYRIDDQENFDSEHLALRLSAGILDLSGVIRVLGEFIAARNSRIVPHKIFGHWAQKPLGFYNWRAVKYLMFEYEQSLRESSRDTREKLHWKEFVGEGRGKNYSSIEHILPQKITNQYWKAMLEGYSLKERNQLKHTLGNLLPMSRPKNASLGNKSFADKKGTSLLNSGYSFGCYSENEVARESDWTPSSIVDRSVRMLDFIEKRWNVKIGTRQEKISMLGLDFVKS
jgi:Protein of unknown function DUF262/Protein of unknown function (DUF1524)